MKNILAENMLRFGTKNVSEADIKKRLTEATLKELDPLMANANKYFQAEWEKNTNGPQFATANLMYVTEVSKDINQASKYNMYFYRARVTGNSFTSFILPQFIGYGDWFPVRTSTPSGFLNDQFNELTSEFNPLQGEPNLKATATQINDIWKDIDEQVALTHLNGRKAKIATSIASIKSSTNFAALGPMLTGTAKSVYDMIAAA